MDTFDNDQLLDQQLPPQESPVDPQQPPVAYVVCAGENGEATVWQLAVDTDETEPPVEPAAAVSDIPEQKLKKEKKKGRGWLWAAIIILAVALLVQPLVLIACLGDGSGTVGRSVVGANINTRGELVIHYSDGTQDVLGNVVNQSSPGNSGTTVTPSVGNNGSDTTAAINNAMRSAVSISCTFYPKGTLGTGSAYGSAGSGVIYQLDKTNGDALIVTNYHVVYDAESRQNNGISEQILVYLYGGEYADHAIEATYVGGSMYYDIAVLRIRDSEKLRNSDAVAATVADSDTVQVGSTAIAIGNAEGYGMSVTSGVVSVDSEHITMTAADGVTEVDYRVMRVDTAVNHGNSGGGLFDGAGRLIGIVNAKTVDDGVENIGYALPSAVVVAVTDNIIDYCLNASCECVMRPILGVMVTIQDSAAVYDEETGTLSIRELVTVHSVEAGQLGSVFRVGDVLQSVRIGNTEKQITRQHHLIDFMINARVGDQVQFVVLRNGVETTLSVTITQGCLTEY